MVDNNYVNIVEHYEACLEKFGDSHLGVDWPRLEDASLRYEIMLQIIKGEPKENVGILDFGCGLSHLYEYLKKRPRSGNIVYSGLDLSSKFVQVSQSKFPE